MPPAKAGKAGSKSSSSKNSKSSSAKSVLSATASLNSLAVSQAKAKESALACTGAARRNMPYSDIIIDNFSVTFHGTEFVSDTTLELSAGRRYGLIGANGSGKSIMLKAIGEREIPIPMHFDVFHLVSEIEASDKSAVEAVLSVQEERVALEKEVDELAALIDDDTPAEVHDRMNDIYDKLDQMDAKSSEHRAAKILSGLGFTTEMQAKKTRDFSGGWRMRIALARALFINPTLLLLDEPTNHLDIEAVVWLEQYLANFNPKGILVLISHSQDFLNSICTNIIHLHKRTLTTYSGNYDQYVITRSERDENQQKQFRWQQDQIKAMKEYIARFGHGSAKLARQAQSKEKVLAKMERGGLIEEVKADHVLSFTFPDPEQLSPPVLHLQNISFGYPGAELLYQNVDFGIDLDSRIALVGPNGAGKSTLLKLMVNELSPTVGMVRPHGKLRIGRFHQHFVDSMDMTLSPLDYMLTMYPGNPVEKMRSWLGRFDVSGPVQTQRMETLSDGQKSRVVFADIAWRNPHILLLDEPTNHLDMESIDALAFAINQFSGGVVLVSHDMRLISAVAEDIWICEDGKVEKYKGDLQQYKESLIKKMKKLELIS